MKENNLLQNIDSNIPKLLEARPKFAFVYRGSPQAWGATRVAKKIQNIPKSKGLWYIIYKVLLIFLASALLSAQIFHAFYYPVWRDDAFFSSVAKSLANGQGYSAIVFTEAFLFHHGISTGPFLILPAAFLMRLFGNQYWVPSLVNIAVIWFLLVAIFFVVSKQIGKEKSWFYGFVTLLLLLIYSAGNIGGYGVESNDDIALWHLLMGDVAASLLIILAALWLFSASFDQKKIAVSGLIIGLALLTKLTVIFAVITIIAAFAGKISFEKKLKKTQRLKISSLLIIGALAPLGLFELAKIITLGLQQYLVVQLHSLEFYKNIAFIVSSRQDNNIVINTDIAGRISYLLSIFKCWILIFPLVIYVIYQGRKNHSIARFTALVLIFSALLHVIWWVRFSVGIERYLVFALFYFFAGLMLLICEIDYKKQSSSIKWAIFALLMLLIVERQPEAHSLIFDSWGKNPRLQEQLLVVDKIKELQNQGVEVISCGINFELEYLLADQKNFRECKNALENKSASQQMLVSYFIFPGHIASGKSDSSYVNISPISEKILARCSQIYLETQNFSLRWCK